MILVLGDPSLLDYFVVYIKGSPYKSVNITREETFFPFASEINTLQLVGFFFIYCFCCVFFNILVISLFATHLWYIPFSFAADKNMMRNPFGALFSLYSLSKESLLDPMRDLFQVLHMEIRIQWILFHQHKRPALDFVLQFFSLIVYSFLQITSKN